MLQAKKDVKLLGDVKIKPGEIYRRLSNVYEEAYVNKKILTNRLASLLFNDYNTSFDLG